jgi:hypothetical protein
VVGVNLTAALEPSTAQYADWMARRAGLPVDGYIADDNDDVGPLFDWYSNGNTDLTEGRRV